MAIQIGNMESIYLDRVLPDSALEYYQESLDIFKKHSFNPGIADQNSNIAYTYSQKGELVSALTHFQEAEKLYEELGEKEKAALCRENIKALKVNLYIPLAKEVDVRIIAATNRNFEEEVEKGNFKNGLV